MKRFAVGLPTLLTFAAAAHVGRLLGVIGVLGELRAWSVYAAGALVSAVQVAMCLLALRLTSGLNVREALRELGLRAPFARSILFALAATSPMLLAFALTSPLNRDLTVLGVVFGSGVWPLAEEILYRGYAFRQLHQRKRWGFWPAALSIAVIFGLGHLYQIATGGLSPLEGLAVVLITAAGSVLFSWLLARWSYTLWVPFAVHASMNLWWDVFAVDETALGGWLANAARLAAVLLAVALTLRLTPRPARHAPRKPVTFTDKASDSSKPMNR